MENSNIEWTTHTFNPWRGCTKVSQGCANCYAETLSGRNPGTLGVWGPKGTRVIASESMWAQPIKWNKASQEAGERHRVFCASFADVFEGPETMPADCRAKVESARARLLLLILSTPHLDWLLLTKRPENVNGQIERLKNLSLDYIDGEKEGVEFARTAHFNEDFMGALGGYCARWHRGMPPPNVWIGTSVEDQKAADKRIPELLKIPAKARFLSCEPLLGSVDLSDMWLGSYWDASIPDPMTGKQGSFVVTDAPSENGVNWVICGGESGSNARPMHPDWARSLRDQCVAAGVPFLFKQWGEYAPRIVNPPAMMANGLEFSPKEIMTRVGKKNAGRLLDGRTWDEFPEVLI